MRDSVQQVATRLSARDIKWTDSEAVRAVRAGCEVSMARVLYVLETSAAVERLWRDRSAAPKDAVSRQWPSGNGLLLLRIGRSGSGTDATPEFVYRRVDLAADRAATLRFGDVQTVYAILSFENGGPGNTTVPIKLQ